MTEESAKRLLTVKETCTYLCISHTTVYRMIAGKELHPVNIGGRTLFDRKDLDDLIEKAKEPGQEPVRKKGRPPKYAEPSAGKKKSARATHSTRRK